MNADTRPYAVAIALASGTYSVGSAVAGEMAAMPRSDSVMLLVGVVVIVHGLVLLTPLAGRLGRASGPLMIVWAAIMLGNQLPAAAMSGSMMISLDAGMVALAILMLVSGPVMSRSREPM